MPRTVDLERLRPLSNVAAIVGVGDTEYARDYRAGSGSGARDRGSEGELDSYGLAARAFRRALDDAGLQKDEIDGRYVGRLPPLGRRFMTRRVAVEGLFR